MDLVGLSEVAEMAGVSKQAVVNWRERFSDFPAPAAELASGPVWMKKDIEEWLKRREGSVEAISAGVTGSGKIETNQMGLADFDRVDIANTVEVDIKRADSFSVKVTADDNVARHLEINKSGSTLKIRLRPWILFWHATAHITIGMPELRGVKASGATRVSVSGFHSNESLDVTAAGASKVTINKVKAGETHIIGSGASHVNGSLEMADGRIELNGASTIELVGRCGNVRLEVNGASSAQLTEFKMTGADARVSGASNAGVCIDGKLDADISGASRLTYSGQVTMGKLQVTGASSLKQK
jgi:hypothetical protein